jgi:hypothetical protein
MYWSSHSECLRLAEIEGAQPPSSGSAEDASREGYSARTSCFRASRHPYYPTRSVRGVRYSPRFRRCSNVVRNGYAVSSSRKTSGLSNDDKKRASSVVAECRFGRSGTLRTTCNGNSPAESGTAVRPVPTSSDRETGSAVLNKRGPGRPERGRAE